jgi:DNA modification methylase
MQGDTLDDLPQPEYEGAVAVDDLETDGDNPNEMTDEQFGLLCDRMRQNGWLGGPVVTDTDGLIADGEHRWRAAQEIGLAEVPVRQYDIDDAERRLWRQELNKIHGEHDAKRDALEYDYLLDAGKSDEVHELVNAADEDLDELLAEIKMDTSKPAQYEYDPEHNVYFEDCVEGMRERLEDDSVDMVFTSPPYNVNLKEEYQINAGDSEKVKYDDDMDPEEFKAFLRDVFEEVSRVVKPNGHVFINFQNDIRDGTVKPPTDWLPELVPMPWRSFVVWDKGTSATINGKLGEYGDGVYAANWEPIFHFTESPRPLNGTGGEQLGVWDIPASNREFEHDSGDHPAPFPVALVDKALRSTTREGDTVLDPFMGSSTTAVASIEAGREYVGFELDEEGAYKPIIERRIGEAKRAKEATVNADD